VVGIDGNERAMKSATPDKLKVKGTIMIRVSAFYENRPDAQFDFKYYTTKHFPMVMDLMKPFGAIRFEVEKPLGMASGEASSYVAVGTIYFNDMAGLQAGLAKHGAQIMGDIPNYTNLPAAIQFGEIHTP
jgi:uncharacterized protein (TIGR02118 family)